MKRMLSLMLALCMLAALTGALAEAEPWKPSRRRLSKRRRRARSRFPSPTIPLRPPGRRGAIPLPQVGCRWICRAASVGCNGGPGAMIYMHHPSLEQFRKDAEAWYTE